MKRFRAIFCAAILTLLPGAAFAQRDTGASVSATVAAANVDSHTDFSFSGAFGFRFNRIVGLELDTTVVPDVSSPFDDDNDFRIASPASQLILPAIYPPPFFENSGGRLVIFSNNVRASLPVGSDRFEPFFLAGGGIASVRRTADYVYQIYDPAIILMLPTPDLRIPAIPVRRPFVETSVEMALTIGGGISIRATRRVSVDADVRMFRLLGDEDRSVGRFGVGARYRF